MTATAVEKASTNNVVPIDYAAVLTAMGLSPRDPKTQAVVLICERYHLDPVLKHVILVKGNVYITRDGLLTVAHRSGMFDGIEVLDQGADQTHYTAKVAVYRKDMSHPFTYVGRYPKQGGNKEYAPEMAVKCAEVAALRRAFNVTGISPIEERWDVVDAPAAPPPGVDADTGEIAPPAASVRRAPPARKSADGASTTEASVKEEGPTESAPTPPESGPVGTTGRGDGGVTAPPAPSTRQSAAQRAIVTMAAGLGLSDDQRHQVYLYATDGRIDSLAGVTATKDANAVQRTLRDLKTGALNFDSDGDLVVKA